MLFLKQLALLLWKNWLVQKRSPIWSVFELLIPALLVLFPLVAPLLDFLSDGSPKIQPFHPFAITGTSRDFAGKKCSSNTTSFEEIYYTPENEITRNIMKSVERRLNLTSKSYGTKKELMSGIRKYFRKCKTDDICPCSSLLGGVILELEKEKSIFRYTIRLPNADRRVQKLRTIWNTAIFYPHENPINSDMDYYDPWYGPGASVYYRSGFLSLQRAIDASLSEVIANNEISNVHIHGQRMLDEEPINTVMFETLANMSLQYIYFIALIFTIRNIVHEKEAGLKEYMKVMGLRNWLQWLSHFVWSLFKLTIISAWMTVVFKVPIVKGTALLPHTNWLILFSYFLIVSAGVICYAFVVSVFFQSTTPAMVVGGLVHNTAYNVCQFFSSGFLGPASLDYVPWPMTKSVLILLVNNWATSQGFHLILLYESAGVGMQWKYLFKPITIEETLSLGLACGMLFVDMFICLVITWYVEAVYPGSEGIPLKPWFPFQASYWCGGTAKENSEDQSWRKRSVKSVNRATVEPVVSDLSSAIQIHNLVKVFNGGKVLAVNGLNLEIYSDQITALLGHNGAGKTTTMKILTGILPPTSGEISISGYNLKTALNKIRRQLGLCPQTNILYNMLTVNEHLELFCKLKGRKYDKNEVEHMLSVLNLEDKKNKRSETLSGGMKRKLLVAIALIGGSEIVFLDEPTSGMDPAARHSMWEFLKGEKHGRTIILSTHYMEEADVLGDTIAIIARGQLQCAGSSLFLKKHYGTGYNLTVVFGNESKSGDENAKGLLHLIQSRCPDTKLQSSLGLEGSYILPQKYHSRFGDLFAQIEHNKDRFDIKSLGVSITTMEDVFLRVGEIADEEEEDEEDDESPNTVQEQDIEIENLHEGLSCPTKLTGSSRWLQQLKGLFIKRFHLLKRYWILAIPQLLIPIAFAICGIAIFKAASNLGTETVKYKSMPPLKLNLNIFDNVIVPVIAEDGMEKYLKSYTEAISSYPNMETMSIPNHTTMNDYIIGKYERPGGYYKVTRNYIIGATFKTQNKKITAFYQGKVYHTAAITLNILDSALLSQAMGKHVQIEVINDPLDSDIWTPAEKSQREHFSPSATDKILNMPVIMFLLFGHVFLVSSFVVLLIYERLRGAKHLQLLSGVHQTLFWISNSVVDMVIYMVPTTAIIVMLVAAEVKPFVEEGHWAVVVLLYILYASSALPRTYLYSFLFGTPGKAYIVSLVLAIFAVLPTGTISFHLQYAAGSWTIVRTVLEVTLGLVMPEFSFGQALYVLTTTPEEDSNRRPDSKISSSFFQIFAWSNPGIFRYFVFLMLAAIIYWILIVLGEKRILDSAVRWLKAAVCRRNMQIIQGGQLMYQSDDDVQTERDDVSVKILLVENRSTLIARNLTKQFPSIRAVDSLSFRVAEGECFGLLGVNGAGKTTTFEMLIGRLSITEGEAQISGLDIASSWRRAGRNLGYCPQFDALHDRLTGYETLALYARLRGIPESDVTRIVKSIIDAVGIGKHASKLTHRYSGGNKRRLSLGIALVGLPDLLLLDEPTTGVDPAARRAVWDILARLRQRGIAIVLSSHSMEECDALCSRLAIMVHGRLVCIGSSQHLKTKYGTGYSLHLKVQSQDKLQQTKETIAQEFPNSVLKEVHDTILIYELMQSSDTSWSSLFKKLEGLVGPLEIVDYSLSQTTLELVFLRFSRDASTSYSNFELDREPNIVTQL